MDLGRRHVESQFLNLDRAFLSHSFLLGADLPFLCIQALHLHDPLVLSEACLHLVQPDSFAALVDIRSNFPVRSTSQELMLSEQRLVVLSNGGALVCWDEIRAWLIRMLIISSLRGLLWDCDRRLVAENFVALGLQRCTELLAPFINSFIGRLLR